MKKIISVCLLVVSFLMVGMTMDAKTTKKKSTTKTAQTASSKELPKFEDFYFWGYSDDNEKNMFILQPSLKQLQKDLSKYGYQYKGIKFLNHSGDYYRFTRAGGPEILITDYSGYADIFITFNGSNELKKYLEYLKSIGFKGENNIEGGGSITKDGITATYATDGENSIIFTSERFN